MKLLVHTCVFLMALVQCVRSDHPFADNLCVTSHHFDQDRIFPDNQHLLLDSHAYVDLTERTFTNPTWAQLDLDDDSTIWDQRPSTCRRVVKACGGSAPPQDNWLFTGYINYGDAQEVIINATYRVLCRTGTDCEDFVTVYRYDTNTPSPESQTDFNRYTPVAGNDDISYSRLQKSARSGDDRQFIDFKRPSSYQGFYLAFRDTGSCFELKRVIVFFERCVIEDANTGLVIYPEIGLPPYTSTLPRVVDATCAPHSHVRPGSSLAIRAFGGGRCLGNPVCECDEGYMLSGRRECVACPRGSYRSKLDPQTNCLRCPENSVGTEPAQAVCPCRPGFYRPPDTGADAPCLCPPDACKGDLAAVDIANTSVILEWQKPDKTCGSDFWYRLSRSDQSDIGAFVVFEENYVSSRSTVQYRVTGLRPFRSYVFRLEVVNPVFDIAIDKHLRKCDVKLTTAQGAPEEPRFLLNYCRDLVWGNPLNPNGIVDGFELELFDEENPLRSNIVHKEYHDYIHEISESDLPQGLQISETYARVRAKTEALPGEWSYSIPLENCEDLPLECPAPPPCPTQEPAPVCPACPSPDPCPMPEPCPTMEPISCPTSGPVQCGTLPSPTNGGVRVSGTTARSIATYSCDPQYQLVGSSTRECQPSGAWSSSAPTCRLIRCSPLQPPTNGGVTHSGTTVGSTATYTCDSQYQLVGSSTRECQASGRWDGSAPTCRLIRCSPLQPPTNGGVTHSGTTVGSTATYTCDSQYQLVGGSTRECQSNGRWDGSAPVCEGTVEPTMPALPPIRFEHGGTVYTNESVVLASSIGVGDDCLKCVTNKTDCCSSNRAGEFYYPNNGSRVPIAATGHVLFRNRGDRYICLNGREGVVTEGAYRCEIPDSNGVTQKLYITVVNAFGCSALQPPANGKVDLSAGTAVGSIATYSCDPQHILVGRNTRECTTDRTWSGTAPRCLRLSVQCSTLPPPTNGGVRVSGTTVGSTATYTCDSQYQLVGSSTRECQASGRWDGSAPTCRQLGECDPLTHPTNGRVSTAETLATYSCNTGYQLMGNSRRVCRSTGSWSGSTPSCRLIQCSTLRSPTNGGVRVSGTTVGSTATYTCDSQYQLVGSSTRECQASGRWSEREPTCAATVSPTTSPPDVRFEHGNTYYPNNSVIQASVIGEEDDCLKCITDKTDCCGNPNRAGHFFYPNTTQVPILNARHLLYRNRGEQHICLNRGGRPGVVTTGVYCCEIPDSNGRLQKLFIRIN